MTEDRAYLSWVAHHRAGFVLDCLRQPTKARPVLHRATCPQIKHAQSKRTHWTTGRHVKACSLDRDELERWAREQAHNDPVPCVDCRPDQDYYAVGSNPEDEPHLTRLDREILSYVLEIAICHLDDDHHPYALSVGMVAQCLGKTPGQLAAACARLAADGLLVISGPAKRGHPLAPQRRVVPTARALRTIPSFADLDETQLNIELQKLSHVGMENAPPAR